MLRPDAPWCTLCYADPRPAPAPVPLPPSTTPASPGREEPSWPCTGCDVRNPLSASACSACGGSFLAAVKDVDGPKLVLPFVGDLGAMSRRRRAGVAAGLVALVLVPLSLVTLLLTQPPVGRTGPASGPGSATTTTVR